MPVLRKSRWPAVWPVAQARIHARLLPFAAAVGADAAIGHGVALALDELRAGLWAYAGPLRPEGEYPDKQTG